jgi:small-conductance mechanosensitive channel
MEEIPTSLVTLWETLTTRGATVLALQLLLMVVAVVAAFFIHRHSQKELVRRLESGGISRLRSLILKIGQRLAFPLSGLFAVLVGQLVFRQFGLETPLLNVLAKLLVALAIVRLIVYALRVGIAPGPGLKAWEKIISTSVWVVLALHLVGWLPHVTAGMDQLAISLGETRLSLLMVVKLLVLSALYVLLAVWLSGLVEQQLKNSKHINTTMRVGLTKVIKVALLSLAFLLALTEAGLNLASLTVFGGALGVGIGFGLQKIVSNFISGFILLGDRSIRPGDVISIGNTYGWVRELRARYAPAAGGRASDTTVGCAE